MASPHFTHSATSSARAPRFREERDRNIRERRQNGEMLRTIASDYGITHQRVSQICADIPRAPFKSEIPVPCAVPDCPVPTFSPRINCDAHRGWRKRLPLKERLMRHVRKTASCWLWEGATIPAGYGHLHLNGTNTFAHRLAYELANGPIPEGLTIDHLCRVPACVNPSHLEAVTMRENVLRGKGPAAKNARKTHCPYGHAYDVIASHRRRCSQCEARRRKQFNARRRERYATDTDYRNRVRRQTLTSYHKRAQARRGA